MTAWETLWVTRAAWWGGSVAREVEVMTSDDDYGVDALVSHQIKAAVGAFLPSFLFAIIPVPYLQFHCVDQPLHLSRSSSFYYFPSSFSRNLQKGVHLQEKK